MPPETTRARHRPPALKPAAGSPATAGTGERAFFPLFDGVRAIAALLVLVVHAGFLSGYTGRGGAGGALTARGEIGVSVFFLISGFLLYRPWAAAHQGLGRRPQVRRYLVRRALRIVPLYWVVLTVFLATGLAGGPRGPLDVVCYYLFAQDYDPARSTGGLGPAWSLDIEVVFYLALPVWAALIARGSGGRTPRNQRRREVSALAAVIIFATGWWVLLMNHPMVGPVQLYLLLPAWADDFALGMLLAVTSVAHQHHPVRPARWVCAPGGAEVCWVLAAACYAVVASPIVGASRSPKTDPSWTIHFWYGMFAFLLLMPAVFSDGRRGPVRSLLGSAPMAFCGLVSYGLYLWHVPILTWLLHEGVWPLFQAPLGPFLGLALALSLALAFLSFRLVERPAMAAGARRVVRRRETPRGPDGRRRSPLR